MDRDNRDDRKRPHPPGDTHRPKSLRPDNGERRDHDREGHRDRNRDRDRDRSRDNGGRERHESVGSPASTSSSASAHSGNGNRLQESPRLPCSTNGYQGRGRGSHHASSSRQPPSGSPHVQEPTPGSSGNDGFDINTNSPRGGGGGRGRGELHSRLQNMASESTVDINDPTQERSSRGGGRGRGRGGRGARRPRPSDAQLANFVCTRPKDAKNQPQVKTAGLTKGLSRSVELVANYYPMISRINWTLYNYHVDFLPEIEHTFEKQCLFRPHKERLGWHVLNGDALYTNHKLTPELMVLSSEREGDRGKVDIRINPTATEVQPSDPVNIQIYNVIIRDCMRLLNLEQMGRHYYNEREKVAFPAERLEIWPGYKTSLRQHETQLLLCVEMTNKVFQLQNVNAFIKEFRSPDKERIKNELLGCVVMTPHNRKTYRIDDVKWDETPSITFDCKGNQVTLAQYNKDRYQLEVRDMFQPILYSRASRQAIRRGMTQNTALIPELCLMTGLRDSQRNNFGLMRTLNRVLQLNPGDRVNQIKKFANILTQNRIRETVLANAGLELSSDLVTVQGKELKPETIFAAKELKFPLQPTDRNYYDWSVDLLRNHMALTVNLINWVVIHVQGQGCVEEFVRILSRSGSDMNFRVSNPSYKEASNNHREQLRSFLDLIDNEMAIRKDKLQLIMCVLPDKHESLYGEIKRKCFQQWGIPSQCVVAKNIMPGKQQRGVAGKLAIQMNTKLGGVPWMVKIPMKGVMTIGYSVSVTGRAKSGAKGQSMGALAAAMNDEQTKYFSIPVEVDRSQNLSTVLGLKIVACIRAYQRINGKLPVRIIYYRDGVGDGQLQAVVETELTEIKKAINDLYPSPETAPKFGFIVVSKRINTKFFHFHQTGRDQYENPRPGTVVDDVVTLNERYDFYLVAAKGTGQGTVSPVSYNIIYDDMGLDSAKIQMLTFKLCHLYFNWNSTVSVPACCQYAHKLAFVYNLINKTGRGQDGGIDPVDRLCDSLYYL